MSETSALDHRPSWDEYFMKLANEVATRTTCMRRGVGAIIVKDRRILATGYNGVPSGLAHSRSFYRRHTPINRRHHLSD